MNYLTAHSEVGANILAKSGYALRQVSFEGDGFEYIFEIPSVLPDGREALSGSGFPAADNIPERVNVLSVSILSDKTHAKQDASGRNQMLCIAGADAFFEKANLCQNFKGTLRLDFEGVFHDETILRATLERQGAMEDAK